MHLGLKILHISAMAVWFTGLFLLPRLLAARHAPIPDAEPAYFNPVANTLYFRVMTPAGVTTIVLGMLLLPYAELGAWLVAKLVLVLIAVFVHLQLGVHLYQIGQGEDRQGPWFYRVICWAPLLLVLAMAALTGAKPATVANLPAPPAAIDRAS